MIISSDDMYKMTHKTWAARHPCKFHFVVTWLGLDLHKYGLRIYAVPFLRHILTRTLGRFELFSDRLTDPRAQNMRTLYFDFWPGIDMICGLNLKMLRMR